MLDPFAEFWGQPKASGPLTALIGGQLPAGIRNNNPGNIKYFKGVSYPGLVGPSENRDEGDPQMVFDTPQNGMNAASQLALKKYSGGKRTANDLIAGNMGWTPGNRNAAANVSRIMGIGPDDDLGLSDPSRMRSFLKALTFQEQGAPSRAYGDDVYAGVGGGEAPARPAMQERTQMPMPRQPGPLTSAMGGMSNSMVPGIFGGGDEPGYFGKLLADPAFLTGASVLGGGLAGQDFGTALSRGTQGAAAQSEMFDKRRKAAAWQKIFPTNGPPDMSSPMLKGLPPEAVPLVAQMGPEEGMKALTQLAFKRMEPGNLTSVAPGSTLFNEKSQQPVFTAPSQPKEKKFEFTKYGIGDPSEGTIKPYPTGAADPELTLEQSKHEQSLRKEYTMLSSDMRTINDSVGKLRAGQRLDSGQGDIAMVYAYMKMLDPTSVVREGEYATAENTGGAAQKLIGTYNKLLTGERLLPAERDKFVTAAESLAGEKTERFAKLRSQYEDVARKAGADPNRVMLDEGKGVVSPPPPGAPGAGAPAAAVDPRALQMLKSNPTPQTMQQFDEVFGQGAAAKALGR